MLEIEFTPEARDDLRALRKNDQVEIVAAVQVQLQYEPTVETRNLGKNHENNSGSGPCQNTQ